MYALEFYEKSLLFPNLLLVVRQMFTSMICFVELKPNAKEGDHMIVQSIEPIFPKGFPLILPCLPQKRRLENESK